MQTITQTERTFAYSSSLDRRRHDAYSRCASPRTRNSTTAAAAASVARASHSRSRANSMAYRPATIRQPSSARCDSAKSRLCDLRRFTVSENEEIVVQVPEEVSEGLRVALLRRLDRGPASITALTELAPFGSSLTPSANSIHLRKRQASNYIVTRELGPIHGPIRLDQLGPRTIMRYFLSCSWIGPQEAGWSLKP